MSVDLFFLLSGFLITGILLDSKTRPYYFRNFYIRRFLRIVPLYFLVVLVWWVCYCGYSQYFRLSLFFGANLAPILHVPVPHGPGVLWSLAVEEHFYLLWPAVVYFLDRRKILLLCVAILAICPVLRAIYAAKGMDPDVIYLLSWFRFDGLAAGAVLAILWRTKNFHTRSAVRWIAVALSGALSYCLYLVHLAVGDLFEFLRARQHSLSMGPTYIVWLRGSFLVFVSFGIALLTRKFIENPVLALKDRFTLPLRNDAASLEPSTVGNASA